MCTSKRKTLLVTLRSILLPLALLGILPLTVPAQQQITYMQYNLLNYGNFTSYCTESNNNLEAKKEALRVILDYIRPDILAVNEVGENSYNATELLDEVLNTNTYGVIYQRADRTNAANSDLINLFFYNREKLRLKRQQVVQTFIRDINYYQLYRTGEIAHRSDTSFLHCFVAHLKAGRDSEDEEKRAQMIHNLMEYVESNELTEAVLFSGDMNFYDGEEEGVATLLEYPDEQLRFQDPIQQVGRWHNNSRYAPFHTQSTHSNSNGCASGGGMDDRFDFIFINESIARGLHGVSYVEESYHVVGNDGLHFNKGLNEGPVNQDVPEEIRDALYEMSDHLPVVMELQMAKSHKITEFASAYPKIYVSNPVKRGETIRLSCLTRSHAHYTLQLVDLTGRVWVERTGILPVGHTSLRLRTPEASGIFLLVFRFNSNSVITRKILIQEKR